MPYLDTKNFQELASKIFDQFLETKNFIKRLSDTNSILYGKAGLFIKIYYDSREGEIEIMFKLQKHDEDFFLNYQNGIPVKDYITFDEISKYLFGKENKSNIVRKKNAVVKELERLQHFIAEHWDLIIPENYQTFFNKVLESSQKDIINEIQNEVIKKIITDGNYFTNKLNFVFMNREQKIIYNDLIKELKEKNIIHYKLDLKGAKTVTDIFNIFNREMNIPYNVQNWDALEECINDLAWEDNDYYILFISNISTLIEKGEPLIKMLFEILTRAVKEWSETHTLFKVIVYDENAETIEKAKDLYSEINII